MKKHKFDIIYESIVSNSTDFLKEFFSRYLLSQIEINTNLLKQDKFVETTFLNNEFKNIGIFLFGLKFENYSINFVLENNELVIYGDSNPKFWDINTPQIKEEFNSISAQEILSHAWINNFIEKILLVQNQCFEQTKEENPYK